MATITLFGNLGSEPKANTAANGKEFVSLSIGEQRSYLDKDKDEYVRTGTDWHNVVIFSPHVQAHALNMRKGSRVKIEGTLSYRVAGKTAEGHDILSTNIIATRIESAPLAKKPQEGTGYTTKTA